MSHVDNHVPDTPYKGLMPYSEEDAPFFFGREAEREIITANLMASRLTVLYGASGVGKSSILHAGVAHHLHQLAQQNLAEYGTPEFAVVLFSSWRDDPLPGLADQVKDSVVRALNGKTFEPVPPSRALAQTLQAWTEHVGGDLFIILDQFEEYFLYHLQEDGEGTFAVEFPRAVNRPDLRVSFLVSIREDSLAKLDRFKGRIPNLFDNYLRLEHLDREAARAAIEKPIEKYNSLPVANGQSVSIEPALIEAVLEQVRTGRVVLGEAGRGGVGVSRMPSEARIETPYLQLVMTRLWDEETAAGSSVLWLETLNRLGGAERIVRTHLDAAMSALLAKERDVAARVFHFLVTPGGTKIAHTVPDLVEYAKLSQTQLTPVLDKLAGTGVRILRPVAPPADQPAARRYEVFHDVLAPAILDWRARYVRRVRARRWQIAGITLGVVILLVIAGLIVNEQNTRAQLELKVQEVSMAQQELDTINEKLQGSQQELASVNEQLAEGREQLTEAQEQLARAREQLAEAQEQLAEAQEQVNGAQEELVATKENLKQAQEEAATLAAEAERYLKDVADLQGRVEELNKTLEGLTKLQEHAFTGHVELTLKYLAMSNPQASELLVDILDMQYAGVGWKLGGLSPEGGFDSPSFAAYVLEKQGLLPVPASSARYRLREVLPARDRPRVGDVVFYELGYTMFYFVDQQERPFVMGMTPLGIYALEVDFAPKLGYGEVKYP